MNIAVSFWQAEQYALFNNSVYSSKYHFPPRTENKNMT